MPVYPEIEARHKRPKRARPFRTGPLGRLRIDVDDGAQSVATHRGRGARENRRSASRERPRRGRLRQQLSAMATAKAEKRRRPEEAGIGRVERSSQLPERPADVARVRSRDDQ